MAFEGVNHFSSLFKEDTHATIAEVIRLSNSFPSFVNEEDNQGLDKGGWERRIVSNLYKSFQKDKSPGLDGLPMEFFLGCYDFIEEYLQRVVETTRTQGKMLGAFNTTFLALIPKEDNPTTFEKFRPISLCNCIYKIISKVIARRLKSVLSNQISGEQFGFLEGRKIHEAVGVAQECIHSIKVQKPKIDGDESGPVQSL
jgi:hypothetical protein